MFKKVKKLSFISIVTIIIVSIGFFIGFAIVPSIIEKHKTPDDFSIIMKGKIYSCTSPNDKEFDYVIKKYDIKSILFISNANNDNFSYLFNYINNNNNLSFSTLLYTNSFVPAYNIVNNFINYLNTQSNLPVLVCSLNNINYTEKLITIYRVACLKWEFDDALSQCHCTKKIINNPEKLKSLAYQIKYEQLANRPKVKDKKNALSFVVLGDVYHRVWQEILRNIWHNCVKDQQVPASFIIGIGDMLNSKKLYLIYRKFFSAKKTDVPIYLPVLGNHEIYPAYNNDEQEVRDEIIPAIKSAVRYSKTTCNYYIDKKNTRFIIIDPYTDFGTEGIINDAGRLWTESVITSAPAYIKHIFIFSHEPAFPRVRHLKDSFNENPRLRNQFWNMLLRHKDRVRALFCGHTHHYYKLKIANPKSEEANSPDIFPIQKNGIYQIDVGAAGRPHTLNETYVQTIIADDKIKVNVYQRERSTFFSRLKEKIFIKNKYSNLFKLTDTFQIYPDAN